MRIARSLIGLSCVCVLGLAAPEAHAQGTPPSLLPGASEGPKSYTIDPNKRDFAEIKFSVEAEIENHIQYSAENYMKFVKHVRFDGVVRLKYVYGGGVYTEGAPAPPLPEIPPSRELDFIMEGFRACERETDAAKAGMCTGDATRAGQAKFQKCQKAATEAERTTLGCGGNAGPSPEGMFDVYGGSKGKGRFDPNRQGDLRNWVPVSCIGKTTVTGAGEGYDGSIQPNPRYTFKIRGDWEAVPSETGSGAGCGASALINIKTGEVQLVLQPAPLHIRSRNSYDNFRGVEVTSDRTFEEIEGTNGIAINLKIPPGSKSFSGVWRPPATPRPDSGPKRRAVQTVAHYTFSSN